MPFDCGLATGVVRGTKPMSRPNWSFVGVDPSQPMLDLAAQALGPLGAQVKWVHGYIDDAPSGPYDGATCLLTLHFLPSRERLRVLQALRDRLKPGAPLIVAHHSSPQAGQAERWLARSAAFAAGTQADVAQAAASAAGMVQNLTLLSAEDEEALLRQATRLFSTRDSHSEAGLPSQGWVDRHLEGYGVGVVLSFIYDGAPSRSVPKL